MPRSARRNLSQAGRYKHRESTLFEDSSKLAIRFRHSVIALPQSRSLGRTSPTLVGIPHSHPRHVRCRSLVRNQVIHHRERISGRSSGFSSLCARSIVKAMLIWFVYQVELRGSLSASCLERTGVAEIMVGRRVFHPG